MPEILHTYIQLNSLYCQYIVPIKIMSFSPNIFFKMFQLTQTGCTTGQSKSKFIYNNNNNNKKLNTFKKIKKIAQH